MKNILGAILALAFMAGVMSSPVMAHENPCSMKDMQKHNPCSMKMMDNPCNMKKNPCSMKPMHNPCSMKENPCSMSHNPCSMKKHPSSMSHNPCGMKKNPCSMKPMHNPCSMKKNPCHMSANPCSADVKKKIRPQAFNSFQDAVDMGRKMWNDDEGMGKAGVACLSCHADFDMLHFDKHQNFPHYVKMVGDVVTLDQMINYCLLNPMQGHELAQNSKEMTAMAAYYRAYRMKYLQEHRKQ